MDNFNEQEEIFSNKVRAGKRTYFFDVRSTRSQDYYLTITESKKTASWKITDAFENIGKLKLKKGPKVKFV